MAYLSKEEVKKIIENRPSGVSERAVVESLVNKGHTIEGLSEGRDGEPGLRERVSGVIERAGEGVQERITGEGEFADDNVLTRGIGATAEAAIAVPEVALQAIPKQLGGGQIRSGVEKVGDLLSRGFGKAVDYLSETKPIKSLAGELVEGEDGVVDYVPRDLGALEETLKQYASLGEVSGVTAGAGVGPGQVTRLAGRTRAAVADVGREFLDKSINKAGALADKATPKSVRTLFRMNDPETRRTAVDQLEDAYKTGLVEDRKAINNKLDTLAAGESFGSTSFTRDSLIRELAEEGYLPKIEGSYAKFDDVFDDISTRQRDLMVDIDNNLAPLQGTEYRTSLQRLRDEAEMSLRESPQIGAGLTSSVRELDRMFDSLANKYGESVSPLELNDIRKEMNKLTGAYKAKQGEKIFEFDAADAVAKSARSRIDQFAPEVRDLNFEWARLNRVDQTARILHNEVVEVGLIGRKLGSYVGTIGASLAGLQLAGPGGLVAASVFAQLGSDALAKVLRSRKFDPKLREAIINEIKKEPEVAEKLIREASPENKKFLRNLLIGGAVAGGAKFFTSEDDGSIVSLVAIGAMSGKDKSRAIKELKDMKKVWNDRANAPDAPKSVVRAAEKANKQIDKQIAGIQEAQD